jgi:hypothetical protein
MIDLKQSEIYTRSKYIIQALDDGFIWMATMSNQQMKASILDWIQQDQLTEQGVDSEGEVIGFYSRLTQSINPEKKFDTHYTLDDTGDFYRSMVIVVLKKAILINADSQKMEDQDWWRNEILELTDENIEKLREAYRIEVQNYVRDVLLGRR